MTFDHTPRESSISKIQLADAVSAQKYTRRDTQFGGEQNYTIRCDSGPAKFVARRHMTLRTAR